MNLQEQIIEEFEKVWRMSVDVLNDDGVGSWGKWAMAQKEITGFILKALKQQEEQVRGEVKEEILKAFPDEMDVKLNESLKDKIFSTANVGFNKCLSEVRSIIEKI